MREALAALLEQVDSRKGDQWWDPCCSSCYHVPWHRDRFGPGIGVVTGDDAWRPKVPKCTCACHEARRLLDIEDALHDERWHCAC